MRMRSALAVVALAAPMTAVASGTAMAAPTDGWTQLSWNSSSYYVQNRTDAPLNQRFTITDGVYNVNVRSGEERVEMRWDNWANRASTTEAAPPGTSRTAPTTTACRRAHGRPCTSATSSCGGTTSSRRLT